MGKKIYLMICAMVVFFLMLSPETVFSNTEVKWNDQKYPLEIIEEENQIISAIKDEVSEIGIINLIKDMSDFGLDIGMDSWLKFLKMDYSREHLEHIYQVQILESEIKNDFRFGSLYGLNRDEFTILENYYFEYLANEKGISFDIVSALSIMACSNTYYHPGIDHSCAFFCTFEYGSSLLIIARPETNGAVWEKVFFWPSKYEDFVDYLDYLKEADSQFEYSIEMVSEIGQGMADRQVSKTENPESPEALEILSLINTHVQSIWFESFFKEYLNQFETSSFYSSFNELFAGKYVSDGIISIYKVSVDTSSGMLQLLDAPWLESFCDSNILKEKIEKLFITMLGTYISTYDFDYGARNGLYSVNNAVLGNLSFSYYSTTAIDESCIFFYDFKNGWPVMVCCLKGKDGTTEERAQFIDWPYIDEDVLQSLFLSDDQEENDPSSWLHIEKVYRD